jgi:hypothetical protein
LGAAHDVVASFIEILAIFTQQLKLLVVVMRASIIHQIDIVLIVGDGEEEVVKISCIIVCVVTYILAVALGYRVP